MVAFVIQRWYIWQPDLAIDTTVAILRMVNIVAQRSPRRLVVPTRQEGSTCIVVVAEWRHKGRTLVAIWNNALYLKQNLSLSERCFYRHCTTIALPLCLHSPTKAIFEPPSQLTCPHFVLRATCCDCIAVLVAQGRNKSRTAAVAQKQGFLCLSNQGPVHVAAMCEGGFRRLSRLASRGPVEYHQPYSCIVQEKIRYSSEGCLQKRVWSWVSAH